MEKKAFLAALQRMRDESRQRKFTQSIELMVNFKGLDFKKPDNQIDIRVTMPFATGKGRGKVLVFAKDKSFMEQIKDKVDKVIAEPEIQGLNKKQIAEITEAYDVLLAEGPVMLTVGKFLGQQLAPKGKMPKPIAPNSAVIESSLKEMSSVTRVTNRKGKPVPVIQLVIGSEKMENEQLAGNAKAVVDAVVNALPGKTQNLKSVFIKETMGPAIKVGDGK